MNQSIASFELELVAMGVTIREFRQPNGTVSEVIGSIGGVLYKWNSFGHCFIAGSKIPAPQYNLKSLNFIQISEDQKRVIHGKVTHKFHRSFFWFLSKSCSKCSLVGPCTKSKQTDFPFPCHSAIRADKHNGYFTL